MVRALKYPLHSDSAIFWGDDAIQAFILHGDFIFDRIRSRVSYARQITPDFATV